MAIYRLEAKLLKRASGRSAIAASAYRSGSRLYDCRQGRTFNYLNKRDVEHAEILTPVSAPEWATDRETLWNRAEAKEDRSTRPKDAQVARDVTLALPRELNAAQRLQLIRGFINHAFTKRGMIADMAMHCPTSKTDGLPQPHVHLLLTLRRITAEGFGKKERAWNQPTLLESWRCDWADSVNRALERASSQNRVDHRSLAAQGILRKPEPKCGRGQHMSTRGQDSYAVKHWKAIRHHNHVVNGAMLRRPANPDPNECRKRSEIAQERRKSILVTTPHGSR